MEHEKKKTRRPPLKEKHCLGLISLVRASGLARWLSEAGLSYESTEQIMSLMEYARSLESWMDGRQEHER